MEGTPLSIDTPPTSKLKKVRSLAICLEVVLNCAPINVHKNLHPANKVKYSKQLKTVEPPRLVTLSTTRYILLEILKKIIISTKAGIDIANINPLDY